MQPEIYGYTKAGAPITDQRLAELLAEGWPEERGRDARPPKEQTRRTHDDIAARMRKKYGAFRKVRRRQA